MKKVLILISALTIGLSSSVFAAQTDVDRQQLKTQIEIRNIQMERYKIERQMMLDLNSIKTSTLNRPSEKEALEKSFPLLNEEDNSRNALKESRNAD